MKKALLSALTIISLIPCSPAFGFKGKKTLKRILGINDSRSSTEKNDLLRSPSLSQQERRDAIAEQILNRRREKEEKSRRPIAACDKYGFM